MSRILAVGLPLAGNGKASTAQLSATLRKCGYPFICAGAYQWLDLVRQCGASRILAVGLPLAGNGKASTAPLSATLRECGYPFICARRTKGSTSFVNAARAVFLPWGSLLRETAKPLPTQL